MKLHNKLYLHNHFLGLYYSMNFISFYPFWPVVIPQIQVASLWAKIGIKRKFHMVIQTTKLLFKPGVR